MQSLSPAVDNSFQALEKESRLHSIRMWGDCVGKRLTLEVALMYEFYKLVGVPSFATKYCCSVFMEK